MDTIFTLPLFILACIQALVSLLLLLPKPVALPLAQLLRSLRKNTATSAVTYTIGGALALLSATSLYQLMQGAERVKASDFRGWVT